MTALMAHDLGPNTSPPTSRRSWPRALWSFASRRRRCGASRPTTRWASRWDFGSVTTYRQPAEAEGRRLYTLCTTENNGETFNAHVVDEAGNVFVELKDYLTVSRPG